MKNFLLFNDFSSEAEHAAELAFLLAGKTGVTLYVWNTIEYTAIPTVKPVLAGVNDSQPEIVHEKNSWFKKLESRLIQQTSLHPVIHFIEGVDYLSDSVLAMVKRYDVGLLIRGVAEGHEKKGYIENNILKSATRSGCPVLLVPRAYPCRTFEKMVYATDLRFCRHEVVVFLTQLARSINAGILIANIPEKGLPLMEERYAISVFEDAVLNPANRDHIYFTNIRERDVSTALDVLVNSLNNDLLVMVNNKFHFNELLGHETPYAVPDNIPIPLLVFPS